MKVQEWAESILCQRWCRVFPRCGCGSGLLEGSSAAFVARLLTPWVASVAPAHPSVSSSAQGENLGDKGGFVVRTVVSCRSFRS